MRKNWHGLMKVLEVELLSETGKSIWKKTNLYNMLHDEGEQLLLQALFIGGNASNGFIPTNYYFGLDNRSTIAAADNMALIFSSGEPTVNGYARQIVPSTSPGGFTITLNDGVYQATSPVLVFAATTGSWGPVRNLFLTNRNDYAGKLIASVALNEPTTVNAGQTLNLKMGLMLRDCE